MWPRPDQGRLHRCYASTGVLYAAVTEPPARQRANAHTSSALQAAAGPICARPARPAPLAPPAGTGLTGRRRRSVRNARHLTSVSSSSPKWRWSSQKAWLVLSPQDRIGGARDGTAPGPGPLSSEIPTWPSRVGFPGIGAGGTRSRAALIRQALSGREQPTGGECEARSCVHDIPGQRLLVHMCAGPWRRSRVFRGQHARSVRSGPGWRPARLADAMTTEPDLALAEIGGSAESLHGPTEWTSGAVWRSHQINCERAGAGRWPLTSPVRCPSVGYPRPIPAPESNCSPVWP